MPCKSLGKGSRPSEDPHGGFFSDVVVGWLEAVLVHQAEGQTHAPEIESVGPSRGEGLTMNEVWKITCGHQREDGKCTRSPVLGETIPSIFSSIVL